MALVCGSGLAGKWGTQAEGSSDGGAGTRLRSLTPPHLCPIFSPQPPASLAQLEFAVAPAARGAGGSIQPPLWAHFAPSAAHRGHAALCLALSFPLSSAERLEQDVPVASADPPSPWVGLGVLRAGTCWSSCGENATYVDACGVHVDCAESDTEAPYLR